MPPRPLAPERVHERFKVLLHELARRDPKGETRGWQKRVANRLEIASTTISNILADQRRVAWNVAFQAADRLKLDRRYFTDDEDFERWLRMMDLENRSEVERRATALSLGNLRRRASEVRRVLREDGVDEQLFEGLQLAREVLDSEMVLAAQRVRTAPVDRQIDAIRTLARVVADRDNPVDRTDADLLITDPSKRAVELRRAFLEALAQAVRDYVLHQRRTGEKVQDADIAGAIERGRKIATSFADEVLAMEHALGPEVSPDALEHMQEIIERSTPDELQALANALRKAGLISAQRKIDRETAGLLSARKK